MTLQLPPTDLDRPLPETSAPEPPRRGPSKVLLVLLGLLVVAVGAVAWAIAAATDVAEEAVAPIAQTPIAEDGVVVIEAINGMSELTTAEAVSFVTVERGVDAGLLNWAAGERVGLLAVANIGAGIDLSEIGPGDVVADPMTGEITIDLPDPAITYVDVDEEATEIYDRDTGIFVSPDPNLEREARLAAEELLTTRALESGLLDEATDKAVVVVTELAEAFGYETVTVLP